MNIISELATQASLIKSGATAPANTILRILIADDNSCAGSRAVFFSMLSHRFGVLRYPENLRHTDTQNSPIGVLTPAYRRLSEFECDATAGGIGAAAAPLTPSLSRFSAERRLDVITAEQF